MQYAYIKYTNMYAFSNSKYPDKGMKIPHMGYSGMPTLRLDDHLIVTTDEFISANTAEDVTAPLPEEIDQLRKLQIGEMMYIHTTKIERIS